METLESLALRPYEYNGQHAIDPLKVANYLAAIEDPSFRRIVQFIIDNTRYITMSELFFELGNIVKDFLKVINDDFYIFLPADKIGSEHYLTAQFYYQIKDNPFFRGIIDTESKIERGHLVFIDDAIYSGIHTIGSIDTLLDNNTVRLIPKRKGISSADYQRNYRETYDNLKDNFCFYILTPFISKHGKEHVKNLGNEFPNKPSKIIFFSQLPEILPIKELCQAKGLRIDYDHFSKILELEESYAEDTAIALYFDHKVANEFGTFPQIYLEGILSDNKTKTGSILKRIPDRF